MQPGVLLPSASVYLLVLCNDRQVLGPWVNGRKTNLCTGSVLAALVTLSVILTAAVLFPRITARQIGAIAIACAAVGLVAAGYAMAARRRRAAPDPAAVAAVPAEDWRMPPLAEPGRAAMSTGRKLGLGALRLYLAVASVLVVVRSRNPRWPADSPAPRATKVNPNVCKTSESLFRRSVRSLHSPPGEPVHVHAHVPMVRAPERQETRP